MKTIAFYISNHGFGHASRNIPIIKSLLKLDSEVYIIVKTGKKQSDFIKQSLKEYLSRVAFYPTIMDVGLTLKKGTFNLDEHALLKETKSFISRWDKYIEAEKFFLEDGKVDLVISDIVPWVYKVAKDLKITSIFISNFSWVEIYREYLSENIWLEYLRCYKLADRAFLYELYHKDLETYFNEINTIGLSCREFDIEKVAEIREKFDKPIVYISLGRSVDIDETISVDEFPYDFIVTEGLRIIGRNVYYIPVDTENTHDYIKASDYVITKAGWGTVAEAMCAGKPMAIISRDYIAEDRNTTEKVISLGLGFNIKLRDLTDMSKVIDNFNKFNYNPDNRKYNNESDKIASNILSYTRRE